MSYSKNTDDDVNMLLDYFNSTFEEIGNLGPNLDNDDESGLQVIHHIPFDFFAPNYLNMILNLIEKM